MFSVIGRGCLSRSSRLTSNRSIPLSFRYTNTRASARDAPSGGSGGSRKTAGIAAAVGLGAGTFGSLAGVGGSLFVIPGLIRFASIPQKEAAGCSLFAVSVISTTSALSYASADAVDWRTAVTLAASAAVASPVGALISRRINKDTLRRILAYFVLCLAPAMPLRGYLMSNSKRVESEDEPDSTENAAKTHNTGIFLGSGAVIGLSSGVLGIGGGGLFTAAIAAFSDIPLRMVLGTSLTAMVAPSVAAAITYARLGQVRPRIVPPLVLGSVSGAALGSRVALNAPEQVLQTGFAIALFVLGIRMLRRPLTG